MKTSEYTRNPDGTLQLKNLQQVAARRKEKHRTEEVISLKQRQERLEQLVLVLQEKILEKEPK